MGPSVPRDGLRIVSEAVIEPVGFPDSEWYDESLDRRIVAEGQVLWEENSCELAGPCGMCEEFCPTGVLHLSGMRTGVPGAVCIRCRLCLFTCPAGALSFVPPKNSPMHQVIE
jgi:NAD-dependent dihydropyrimidine dehydrogenase PreA subunit